VERFRGGGPTSGSLSHCLTSSGVILYPEPVRQNVYWSLRSLHGHSADLFTRKHLGPTSALRAYAILKKTGHSGERGCLGGLTRLPESGSDISSLESVYLYISKSQFAINSNIHSTRTIISSNYNKQGILSSRSNSSASTSKFNRHVA